MLYQLSYTRKRGLHDAWIGPDAARSPSCACGGRPRGRIILAGPACPKPRDVRIYPLPFTFAWNTGRNACGPNPATRHVRQALLGILGRGCANRTLGTRQAGTRPAFGTIPNLPGVCSNCRWFSMLRVILRLMSSWRSGRWLPEAGMAGGPSRATQRKRRRD